MAVRNITSLIARFVGPTWGPSWADRAPYWPHEPCYLGYNRGRHLQLNALGPKPTIYINIIEVFSGCSIDSKSALIQVMFWRQIGGNRRQAITRTNFVDVDIPRLYMFLHVTNTTYKHIIYIYIYICICIYICVCISVMKDYSIWYTCRFGYLTKCLMQNKSTPKKYAKTYSL